MAFSALLAEFDVRPLAMDRFGNSGSDVERVRLDPEPPPVEPRQRPEPPQVVGASMRVRVGAEAAANDQSRDAPALAREPDEARSLVGARGRVLGEVSAGERGGLIRSVVDARMEALPVELVVALLEGGLQRRLQRVP